MSTATRIVEQRHKELLEASEGAVDLSNASSEDRYRQVGQYYRSIPSAQAPLLAFHIRFTNGNTIEVKYAYVTDRIFFQHDTKEAKNLVVIRVRDSMQIKVAGMNLMQLNEDLLRQSVLDIGSVTELQAAAALKSDRSQPVITSIRLEHGRMDVENGLWMPGSGEWSDKEQQWIPVAAPL